MSSRPSTTPRRPTAGGPASRPWRAPAGPSYEKHPWLLQVAASGRPPLGPGVLTKYELGLQAVDGTGLDEVAMDAVFTLVEGFVAGTARAWSTRSTP